MLPPLRAQPRRAEGNAPMAKPVGRTVDHRSSCADRSASIAGTPSTRACASVTASKIGMPSTSHEAADGSNTAEASNSSAVDATAAAKAANRAFILFDVPSLDYPKAVVDDRLLLADSGESTPGPSARNYAPLRRRAKHQTIRPMLAPKGTSSIKQFVKPSCREVPRAGYMSNADSSATRPPPKDPSQSSCHADTDALRLNRKNSGSPNSNSQA